MEAKRRFKIDLENSGISAILLLRKAGELSKIEIPGIPE